MNRGYTYTNIVGGEAAGETVLYFYTTRYTHSCESVWRERIETGAVLLDGKRVREETKLVGGQTLT